MPAKDLYTNAHLFIAALRILEYREKTPPSIKSITEFLDFSSEFGHLICNQLSQKGIIELIKGAYDTRLCIKDHFKLEELPKTENSVLLAAEIKKFQTSKAEITQKVESFKAKQKEKQKNLFADLEKKLKKNLRE